MSFNNRWHDRKWFPYTVAICSGVLLYVVLTHLTPLARVALSFLGLFLPVILGAVVAYIIDPLAVFIENRMLGRMKNAFIRRKLSVVLSLLIVIALIILILASLIPQLIMSVITFISNFDSYMAHIQSLLDMVNERFLDLKLEITSLVSTGSNALYSLLEQLPSYMQEIIYTASQAGSRVGNWLLGFVLAVYFLLDKDRILGWLKRLLSLILGQKHYDRSIVFWKRCNDIMIRYIVFEIIDALIVGVANFIFMLIMGMPYGVLISVVVGVTNLIPTFGPLIGGAVGFVVLLLAAPLQAIIFLIFTCILQTIDGYVLKPRLFGGSLGVPSVLILISIIVGGKLCGIVGILLAIPFAAILSFLYRETFIPWLEARRAKDGEASAPDDISEKL